MTVPTRRFEAQFDHAVWSGITAANSGTVEHFVLGAPMAVATLEVTGTYTGGSIGRLQGTADLLAVIEAGSATWFDLRDRFGLPISVTANGVVEISSGVRAVRPRVEGGSGALDFSLCVAKG